MIKTVDDFLAMAAGADGKTLAVAAAHDADVIDSVVRAKRLGIADSVLVGRASDIEALLEKEGMKGAFEIIDAGSDAEAAAKAVALAKEGRANCLMKGLISTADMMRAVINRETGIRTGKLISHCMFYSVPSYPKIMLNTDGGMNVAPDLEQKARILENAAETLKKLGYEHIYASCVCGAETVNPKIQATVDADALSKMADRWAPYDMDVIGPVGLDLAISPAACRHKGFSAPGCGEADILLVPTYEVGNGIGKTMTYFADARSAGIIVGAAVPMVLTSRADTSDTKLASIALGALVG